MEIKVKSLAEDLAGLPLMEPQVERQIAMNWAARAEFLQGEMARIEKAGAIVFLMFMFASAAAVAELVILLSR
jgi:hypothetical protein